MCDHVMGQQGTSVSLSASLGEMWIGMNADGILLPPISSRCSYQCVIMLG
jgi:hypothetical protein